MTRIRQYTFVGYGTADRETMTDTVYVVHGDPEHRVQTSFHMATGPQYKPAVFDVQNYPSERLAMQLTREWAAKWLRIRHAYANGDYSVFAEGSCSFRRGTAEFVPNMPVDAYAENRIVLHGDDITSYYGSRRSGETADGAAYTEIRLDAGDRDDFHFHDTSDQHPADECQCCSEQCDCIDKLEQCAQCGRDLGDGDECWLCMDGGEVYCDEHVVFDERPDSLFKRVGGVRGAMLPEFAWPGGYTLVYYTRDGETVCAECASQVEVSDPATDAYTDEEMDCKACDHAQSFHASRSFDPDAVWTGTLDVGPCDFDEQRDDQITGKEVYTHCDCEGYFPPVCDDCARPTDPALRAWWASKNAEVKA